MTDQNSSVTEPTPTESAERDVADILSFDPFAPAKETPAPATPAEGTPADGKAGEGEQPPGQPIPKEAAPPTPAVPATPQPSNLEKLIADQTAAIRQSLADRAAPAPAAAAPAAPKFNLGIPEQITNAISSEDPRERSLALHAVVNGVANAVWREAEQMVKTQVETIVQNIPRLIEAHQTVAQRQREVHDDFYGTYKVFPNTDPAFVALVQNVGQVVATEFARAGRRLDWGPELRDEIANRLFQSFPMLKAAHEAARTQTPQNSGRKAPFVAGGGSRPAPTPASEFLDVLKH
jgi:hypothetical protein